MNPALQLKVDKARWWALQNAPYYGILLTNLQDAEAGAGIDTAATDGRRILWNAAWLEKLKDQEVRFVLLHEVEHCARGHIWRFPNPGPETNEACDHVINLALRQVGGISMPEGACADQAFYGLAEEEVLARLRAKPKAAARRCGTGAQGSRTGQRAGSPDSADERAGTRAYTDACGGYTAAAAPGEAPGDGLGKLRDTWTQAVVAAAHLASRQGRGTTPGHLQEAIARATAAPHVDWRAETANFVRTAVGPRADWSRTTRRHAWLPAIVVPRRQREGIERIAVIRDTSGSICAETLAQFNALAENLAQELGCQLLVLDNDTAVRAEYEVAPGEPVPAMAKGRGGTDFRPAFKRINELMTEGWGFSGIVVLTDLDGYQPDTVPAPTLWVSTTTRVARVGRTVNVQLT